MTYLIIAMVAGILGWVLSEMLLRGIRRNGTVHVDLYCGYCGWGLSRGAGYEVYRWEGEVFCSLVCLRHDAVLRERERAMA